MNRRVIVLIGFLLQLIAVLAIFLPSEALRLGGTKASLLTAPIDPRSIFRGDYVTLDYEAGRGLPMDWYDKPVFVVLQKKGDVFERVRFSDTKPSLEQGQICIRAVPEYGRARFRDIAQYFVSEGEGHQFDAAAGTHRLYVDIATDASCRATILGLRVGPEAPLEEDPSVVPPSPVSTPVKPVPAQ